MKAVEVSVHFAAHIFYTLFPGRLVAWGFF